MHLANLGSADRPRYPLPNIKGIIIFMLAVAVAVGVFAGR